MKITTTVAVAALILGVAGTAAAQSPQSVTVGGSAPAICQLPVNWSFVSGAAGANGSQFAGQVWTIPEAALADNSPAAAEYAIRVRGTGFCNASHTITVQSARGGLTAGATGSAAPTGFANRRPLRYEAYWSDAGSNAYGPKAMISTATIPGQSATANYVVSGTLAPPGDRTFDVRIGMARPALGRPLIAGEYSDTLTVTLSPAG
jgi:hypothetical protein